ncbi:MAG: hypothetical protein ACI86M_000008 [Saprospiraceae bacterium]|jgi:hypothetical protein
MRLRLLSTLGLFLIISVCAKAQYFQQDVVFEINASLDSNHMIIATTDITYTNNSSNTLDTFFIHLWANAFSDKLSAFSDQAIRTGNLDFYFASNEELGGYRDLSIGVGSKKMDLYSWENNKDVVYFMLPKSLTPGESITLNTSYELKLPKKFSRMGWKTYDDFLMYWYPTPAVYDQSGWHPMPYLSMGEFYTEVADFKINFETSEENIISSVPFSDRSNGAYKFEGSDIIDFAIIKSKNKKVYKHNLNVQEGELELSVMTKYPKRDSSINEYVKQALAYFENTIGPFPYEALSIIDKGPTAISGMEYPGLITVSGPDDEVSNLRFYVVHELLHQYFYSALAFNQRDYAWLDEGLTTYYQQRYFKDILDYDHYSMNNKILMNDGQPPFLQHLARGQACRHYHAPLSMDVNDIDPVNYGLNAYEIPARMYAHMADYVDINLFDKCMRQFYKDWKGKHPQPNDLRLILEKHTEKDLAWFFEDLVLKDWSYDYKVEKLEEGNLTVKHVSGSTPPYHVTLKSDEGNLITLWIEGHTGTKIFENIREASYSDKEDENINWTSAIIDEKGLSMDINRNNNYKGIKRPIKLVPLAKVDDGRYREIYFAPAFSYNTSDGGQLGIAFYNSTFPTKKLKWALSPAFGFTSGKPIGETWLSYDHYLKSKKIRKIQYKLNAKSYSFRFSEGLDEALRYTRVSPHVSLHFHHAPKEHKYSKLYLKPIFLNEEYFDFQGEDLLIKNRNSALFRLGYEYYDFWELGPSDLNVYLEYQPYTNIIGEKHNYSKINAAYNKSFMFKPHQSIDFRLWASYFITNTQRESANYDGGIVKGSSALIYQGFNDYAYDDYFFNRANQEVRLDNQISYGGGGFKTPLGSQYNIGQSNDLAFALNIKSDLPVKMPKFFPLKLFLDIGYYTSKSTAEQPLTGQSIYSGGALLEFGKGVFSIYLPLFNSQAIRDIYDSEGTGLLGKISFKLDLVRFNPSDIAEDYSF